MVNAKYSKRQLALRGMNKEQREGFQAGESGAGPFANPYSGDPQRHRDWKAGWRASYGHLEDIEGAA